MQDGLPFGQLALRQISACVVAGRSDTQLLAFWWTNAVHLRGFLQSLNLAMAEAAGENAPKHWAAEVCISCWGGNWQGGREHILFSITILWMNHVVVMYADPIDG